MGEKQKVGRRGGCRGRGRAGEGVYRPARLGPFARQAHCEMSSNEINVYKLASRHQTASKASK